MQMFSTPKSIALGIGALVILTCAVYIPALHGGFIFDDEVVISHNPRIKSPDGLKRIWFSTEEWDYFPISYSSFWLEWRLWGANPTGYHITNLALHVAAALLIWAVLRRLSIPGAFLAALLFAVHPVNVESVAWISQRRNVLAMVFFLLSMLWYVHQEEEMSRKGEKETHGGFGFWYWLSLLAFLLAMLSKGSVVVEPVVLLLVVWWRGRRIGVGDLLRIAPLFVVAVALTAVNLWFQTHGLELVVRNAGFAERVVGAGAVVWFYLSKAVLPMHLLFIYPQWHIQIAKRLWWLPVIAATITTAVLMWQGSSRRAKLGRALLFAWGFFCVALVPVLGITDIGFMKYSLVADHYQHIAIIGVVALAAAGWQVWHERSRRTSRLAASVVAIGVIGALSVLTFFQSGLYANAGTMYRATLRGNPDSWVAHYNLGNVLFEAGSVDEAVKQYREAIRIKYDYIEPRNNLGIALSRLGRSDEAIACFQENLKIQPGRPDTYFNLGNVFSEINRPEQAAEQYLQALELKPDYAEAWANLAAAYGDLNRWDVALAAANNALKFAQAQGLTEVMSAIEAWRASNAMKRSH